MSRATKAYASKTQRRDHESQRTVGDVLTYSCDFNGALLTSETIQSANWQSDRSSVGLSGLVVADGVATVTLTASEWGCAQLNLSVTTNQGRTLTQRYVVEVRDICPQLSSSVSWP